MEILMHRLRLQKPLPTPRSLISGTHANLSGSTHKYVPLRLVGDPQLLSMVNPSSSVKRSWENAVTV
jgi:hypothetical protein